MKQHDKEEKYDDVAIRALLIVLNNLDKYMEEGFDSKNTEGEKHHDASITTEQAREIKYRTQILGERVGIVCKDMEVSRQIVSHIKNNTTWKHI